MKKPGQEEGLAREQCESVYSCERARGEIWFVGDLGFASAHDDALGVISSGI